MEDIVISGSVLALFSGMLGAVIAALLACFKLAWSERDRSNARGDLLYGRLQAQYDSRYAEIKAELAAMSAAREASDLAILTQLRELVTAVQALLAQMRGSPTEDG